MEPGAYLSMHHVEENHWWYRSRRTIVKSLIRAVVHDVKGRRILDAGCGTGGNLQLLANLGEVVGLEYNPQAAMLSEQRHVCPIVRAKLPDDLPFPTDSFAMVTMFDVLEHIDNDKATLTSLYNVLSNHGHIVITVPAFPFLWSYHDTTHHHKRRYTRRQLKKLLHDSGFIIDYLSYYNTFLFPIVVLVRGIGKVLGTRSGDDERIPFSPLNRLLEKLFASERLLMPQYHYPFGVSLILIAHKAD